MIICRFCKQECPLIKEDKTRVSYSYSWCEACQTEYGHHDDKVFFYSIRTMHHGKEYAFHIDCLFENYSLKKRLEGVSIRVHRTIVHLQHNPKVTPQNIQAKLQTILTFS